MMMKGRGNKVADCSVADGERGANLSCTARSLARSPSVPSMMSANSGNNLQLAGIGTPIDQNHTDNSSSPLNRHGMAGSCSLKVVVPVAAVTVVVTIVIACLAPMSTLWVSSLKGLTNTCTSCLTTEMNVYRSLLVEKAVDSISTQMSIPPMIADAVKYAVTESAYTSPVPLHNDSSTFRHVLHGIAKQFKPVSNVMVGWQNPQGDHIFGDLQTYYGYHDSSIAPTISFFWLNGTKKGADVPVNLTRRDWWKTGITAWAGSWTAVYKSANPAEGTVLGYTIRAPFSGALIVYPRTVPSAGFADLYTAVHDPVHAAVPVILFHWNISSLLGSIQPEKGNRGRHVAVMIAIIKEQGLCYVDVVPITADGGLVLWSFLITPEKDFMFEIQEKQDEAVDHAYFSLWFVLSAEIFIGILSVAVSVTLSVVLARALDDVIRKLQTVSSGKLSRTASNNALRRSLLKEIDSLNSEVTTMQTALESFSQYVPTQVVRYLCKNRLKPVVGVSTMHCTVMFLDVVDFTRNMEKYGAQSIIEVLSAMFESFSTIITKNSGCIDKYIGDAIMALWGCPVIDHNSEMHACKAVAEILTELSRLNLIFQAKMLPPMRIRVGLHSGEVRAGNVGSSQRLNYTVLGNTVNLASRLEPLNKELATAVLVSDSIRGAARDNTFSWRALGHIYVRGFQKPVLVHEFLGFTAELEPETRQMIQDYAPIDRMLYNNHNGYNNNNNNNQYNGMEPFTAQQVTEAMESYLDRNPYDHAVSQSKQLFATLNNNPNSNNNTNTNNCCDPIIQKRGHRHRHHNHHHHRHSNEGNQCADGDDGDGGDGDGSNDDTSTSTTTPPQPPDSILSSTNNNSSPIPVPITTNNNTN
ncbi:guanylate cyclase [Pelomyxa schiedti]|nr:guanylate cyclase [Pelomyxa schiedti]